MDERPKRGRPVTTGTPPAFAFRIPAELHAEARAIAEARGESLPEVVRAALERYVRRHRGTRKETP